jgi:hypothetical protein
MEAVIRKHYLKYWKLLHIQNLRLINHNLRRCNLSTNELNNGEVQR